MESVIPEDVEKRYEDCLLRLPQIKFSDKLKYQIVLELKERMSNVKGVSDVLAKAFILNFLNYIGFNGALNAIDRYRGEHMNNIEQLFVHLAENGYSIIIKNEEEPTFKEFDLLFIGYAFAILAHTLLCEEASGLAASNNVDTALSISNKARMLRAFLVSRLKSVESSITDLYNILFKGSFIPENFILTDGLDNLQAGTYTTHTVVQEVI